MGSSPPPGRRHVRPERLIAPPIGTDEPESVSVPKNPVTLARSMITTLPSGHKPSMAPESKEKTQSKVELICSTCGKPVSNRARTDVTRYLSVESRCTCGSQERNPGEAEQSAGEIDPAVVENLQDKYEVLSLLGKGGMGSVYKVRDKELDRVFAIKVLHSELTGEQQAVKRFEQEAKASTSLTHVNLCAVYNYGVGKQGAHYLVMDYLDGKSLGEVLVDESYLGAPRAIDLFIQIAEALVHAHMKGVVHRDLKPNNILIEKKGDVELVKIVDFGIAKVLPTESKVTSSNLTQTGEIFGSPLYMSPEQCLGNHLDARSDIYAFGCVMYEALTGIAPFAAENPIKTVLKHINEAPVFIRNLREHFEVPDDLERIILHCLEKEPVARYQTAEELLSDLKKVRDKKPLKFKNDPLKKGAAKAKTKKPNYVAAATAGVAIGAVFIAILIFAPRPTPAPAPAKTAEPKLTGDPYTDAATLDGLSFQYFTQGEYEKAIPYLEFGLKVYKEGGRHFQNANQETGWLADQSQHIGKCYMMLKQYEKAVPYYQEALRLYNKIGKYKFFDEAVNDYVTVLKNLDRSEEADALKQEYDSLPYLGKLEKIP